MSASGINLQKNYINLNVELGLNGAANAKKEQDKNQKIEEKESKNPDLEFEKNPNSEGKTKEELQEIEELKKRDREVKQHEEAHKRAAGSLSASMPNYEYEMGPDGKRYAKDGEVTIDISPVPGDPEATINKAQQIKKAALAPANPSAKDRRVAAEAAKMEREARQELLKSKTGDISIKTNQSDVTYNSKGSLKSNNVGTSSIDKTIM